MWAVLGSHLFMCIVGIIIGYWARDGEIREERKRLEQRARDRLKR